MKNQSGGFIENRLPQLFRPKEANDFVAQHHRHSLPTVGGKFALGVSVEAKVVGVAIAGRPVARRLDDGKTLEVLRVCTDGTPNANSFLYARVKRSADVRFAAEEALKKIDPSASSGGK